jgi:hypothetical protein
MAVNPQLKSLAVRPPKAPNLPIGPVEYDQRYQDQLLNVLRLYFNQVDNFSVGLLNGTGGGSITFPYGAFSSGVTQTAASNTATALTFNTTDFANGFSIVSSSRITPDYPGLYNLQFSVQLQSLSTAPEDTYIWLKQYTAATATLADIPGSTGVVGLLARKNPGDPSHDIKGWNYYISMAAGDYLQIYWSTTNGTDVSIPFYAASASPTKPATQSVVATMSFVSALY